MTVLDRYRVSMALLKDNHVPLTCSPAFECWTEWLDRGYGVDIVYLDYRKAFDLIDHVK